MPKVTKITKNQDQQPEDRITDFLARIARKPANTQRMITLSELSYIHRRKHPDGTPYAPTTNRTLISDYRARIRAELGENTPVLHWFRYSTERVKEYKQHQAEQREDRHRGQRPIDAHKHTEAAVVLLEYTNMINWSIPAAIAGVIALTGRRSYEVGCVGTMTADPDDNGRVIFTGQTKTRDAERAAAAYSIPVLARRDLVLDTLGRLRESKDTNRNGYDTIGPTAPNKPFSQRWGKEIGQWSKRIFRDENGEAIAPRELREAYAAIAHAWYAPRKISALQYYNEVLGHQSGDLDTSAFYMAFYLADWEPPAKVVDLEQRRSRQRD